MQGTVFSIEEFSVYDGPGIRTSVFLKGCPLRCLWCHNPEGQLFESEIVKSPNGCIECGRCVDEADIKNDRICYTQDSIKVCPKNLLRVCGDKYEAQALCEKLLKNKDMLRDGGITFSGGEPLAQSEFLIECLDILKGDLHTAVQTSGFCESEIFKRVLERADYFLFDLKLADDTLHREYTGVSNRNILKNFEMLTQSKKDYVVRIPLIPGITDTKENITEICKIMQKNGADYAELMPYNKMAGSKYKMTGREYELNISAESNTQTEIFESFGIKTKIL